MYTHRILRAIAVWCILLISFLLSQSENKYPIILVHGFIGWGPEEMGGYSYWGGKHDIQEYLESKGYAVYTASIGPVSSNWDRAVELYYQIKGGQVDYGLNHSEEFGIIQKPEGKIFKGLYPRWDADHPVHIIGHSMGGQTARMLQYQLTTIFYSEEDRSRPESSDLLGLSRPGWIHSITTVSTPHDGTTLSEIVTNTIPFLQDFIAVAAVVGNDFYDFDLQQWSFGREKDEPWMEYFRRVRQHPAWDTRNICAWDVSLEGARELNTILIASPDVYYFSYATSGTVLDTSTGRHIPSDDMHLILRANARIMGKSEGYWADGTVTDSSWFENDGIVNTVSMDGPTTGMDGPEPIAVFRKGEALIPGQWYFMGTLNVDHRKVIGHAIRDSNRVRNMFNFYENQCALIQSLPEK